MIIDFFTDIFGHWRYLPIHGTYPNETSITSQLSRQVKSFLFTKEPLSLAQLSIIAFSKLSAISKGNGKRLSVNYKHPWRKIVDTFSLSLQSGNDFFWVIDSVSTSSVSKIINDEQNDIPHYMVVLKVRWQ